MDRRTFLRCLAATGAVLSSGYALEAAASLAPPQIPTTTTTRFTFVDNVLTFYTSLPLGTETVVCDIGCDDANGVIKECALVDTNGTLVMRHKNQSIVKTSDYSMSVTFNLLNLNEAQ